MKPDRSFKSSSCDGKQIQPPNINVVRTSSMLGSKLKGENWSTLDSGPLRIRGARARAPVTKELLDMANVFGVPVVPDVCRAYKRLLGSVACE
jgi:hypothetical protein